MEKTHIDQLITPPLLIKSTKNRAAQHMSMLHNALYIYII